MHLLRSSIDYSVAEKKPRFSGLKRPNRRHQCPTHPVAEKKTRFSGLKQTVVCKWALLRPVAEKKTRFSGLKLQQPASQQPPDPVAEKKTRFSGVKHRPARYTKRSRSGRREEDAADLFVIAEILGHSDLIMTKRYTHATDERKRRALEHLAQYSKRKVEKRVASSSILTTLSQ